MKQSFCKCFITLMLIYTAFPANAADGWRAELPDLKLVGSGKLKVFFMDIYKLRLYSPNGRYSSEDNFVLEFEYLKPVSKNTIVDASISELSKLYDVSFEQKTLWRGILNRGLSDMEAGEMAAVTFTKPGTIKFYSRGEMQASFNNPKFKEYFASIWLGKRTSRPNLKKQLLGQ
ncbi:chalcone isomerase family protein [Candidatus Puniceispirillum sp.]|nr:chalcone isomerase family protein [Candidatus Puniceispirillum sp.]